MEWWSILLIILALMMLLLFSGLPVAFAFLVVNLFGLLMWAGGVHSFFVVVSSAVTMLTSFVLVPVALFVLMGEILFNSGVIRLVLDALDKWIGGIPGRLSLLSVVGGTLFATLSGSSIASAATLGSLLAPEMMERGYSKQMTIGPIMGSGILATLIPPSSMAVLLAAIAGVSVAHLLIAIVVPGVLLASLYFAYILVRTSIQPALAPPYAGEEVSFRERVISLRYIIPLGFIIFMVTGVIFVGVATPSEASALGALATIILAATYRRLTWNIFKKTIIGTVQVTAMVFAIIMNAIVFSQILAYTGATKGLIVIATTLPVPPLVLMIIMQLVVLMLGTFMDILAILMITIPIFMPVVLALGFEPIWFCVMMLVNIELGLLTPPFGMVLFVTKGVVPEASMGDIYRASVPFWLIGMVGIGLILAFPQLATWLPGLMRG